MRQNDGLAVRRPPQGPGGALQMRGVNAPTPSNPQPVPGGCGGGSGNQLCEVQQGDLVITFTKNGGAWLYNPSQLTIVANEGTIATSYLTFAAFFHVLCDQVTRMPRARTRVTLTGTGNNQVIVDSPTSQTESLFAFFDFRFSRSDLQADDSFDFNLKGADDGYESFTEEGIEAQLEGDCMAARAFHFPCSDAIGKGQFAPRMFKIFNDHDHGSQGITSDVTSVPNTGRIKISTYDGRNPRHENCFTTMQKMRAVTDLAMGQALMREMGAALIVNPNNEEDADLKG